MSEDAVEFVLKPRRQRKPVETPLPVCTEPMVDKEPPLRLSPTYDPMICVLFDNSLWSTLYWPFFAKVAHFLGHDKSLALVANHIDINLFRRFVEEFGTFSADRATEFLQHFQNVVSRSASYETKKNFQSIRDVVHVVWDHTSPETIGKLWGEKREVYTPLIHALVKKVVNPIICKIIDSKFALVVRTCKAFPSNMKDPLVWWELCTNHATCDLFAELVAKTHQLEYYGTKKGAFTKEQKSMLHNSIYVIETYMGRCMAIQLPNWSPYQTRVWLDLNRFDQFRNKMTNGIF